MLGRVLITGSKGQLGRALMRLVEAEEVLGVDIEELDVTDEKAVRKALLSFGPEWVLHCAAATDVDLCESRKGWAEASNAEAPGHVARACKEAGASMVYYSTDFVFDGGSTEPYREEDPPNPISVYGATKLRGEEAVRRSGLPSVLVLRTQWVFGPGGRNFPAAILGKARAGEDLRVVDDQVGSPTYTLDLARASLELAQALMEGRTEPGLFHVANRGVYSWYDFARLILEKAGIRGVRIERIGSSDLGLPAKRPAWSVLDTGKLEAVLGGGLPPVADAVARYLDEEES